MSRRIRSSSTHIEVTELRKCGAPVRFRWRGRCYDVRQVLAHWVEAAPWWRGLNGRCLAHDIWRVEATAGTDANGADDVGVYDLSLVSEHWRLLRVMD